MAETTEKTAKSAPVFPLPKLREHCRELFDISASTFDGATFNLDADGCYTVEDVKKTIKNWLGRSVE